MSYYIYIYIYIYIYNFILVNLFPKIFINIIFEQKLLCFYI